MNEIESKIKNTKNFGIVHEDDLKKFKEFYKNLINQSHKEKEKNLLVCLERSDKFLRCRYEKLNESVQEKLAFEGIS